MPRLHIFGCFRAITPYSIGFNQKMQILLRRRPNIMDLAPFLFDGHNVTPGNADSVIQSSGASDKNFRDLRCIRFADRTRQAAAMKAPSLGPHPRSEP
jgi:hypothetical protein